MREYREPDGDNARWDGFEFRPGDVVIAAPSKSGTTWTQLLVALLIFDGADFPESIGRMSMWMDQRTRTVEEAHAAFAAQTHRRFIKTHTPHWTGCRSSTRSVMCVWDATPGMPPYP